MKIICNTPGKGREVNPYDGNYSPELYDGFEESVVLLDAFYQDGKTLLPIGEFEVEKKTQVKDMVGGPWHFGTLRPFSENPIRKVYVALTPAPDAKEPVNQNTPMKKLTQEAKTALHEHKYGIMMSELCDLLCTSPDRIKAMSIDIATGLTDPHLMQDDVLEIISRHTNIPVKDLTASTYAPPVKAVEEEKRMSQLQRLHLIGKYLSDLGDMFNDGSGSKAQLLAYGKELLAIQPSLQSVESALIALAGEAVMRYPSIGEFDIVSMQKRVSFIAGANDLKQTHVPVEEMDEVLELTKKKVIEVVNSMPGLFRNGSCKLTLINLIKSLTKKQ